MSELIHVNDKGTMIQDKSSDKYLKCGKCGFKVKKSEIYAKYDEGVLDVPIKR
jgi:hypothetical protein